MIRLSHVMTFAVLAAIALGAAVDDARAATKSKGLWGSHCSGLETQKEKKACCLKLLTDCTIDCKGYKGDAFTLCQKKCTDKHSTCLADVKSAIVVPPSRGTLYDTRAQGNSQGERSGGKLKTSPSSNQER
jgi:hypothetical protein